jgi:hypothetical protein
MQSGPCKSKLLMVTNHLLLYFLKIRISPKKERSGFENIFFICPLDGQTQFFGPFHWPTLRYSTLLYATLRYSTLLYSTLRYSTLLYADVSSPRHWCALTSKWLDPNYTTYYLWWRRSHFCAIILFEFLKSVLFSCFWEKHYTY